MVTAMTNDSSKTRYEKTRIVSARALQISQGAPVLVKLPRGVTRPIDIAELEWDAGVIPIEIRKNQASAGKEE
jgi:DNA-directed RNA polymerase subunit K